MKESLAARQEALHRQNAELNEQVEAIEQRRQQQLASASRPASSSSSTSLHTARKTPSPADPEIESGELDQEEDVKASHASLEMDLSASIDSFGSQDLRAARRQHAKAESKENATIASTTRSAKGETKEDGGPGEEMSGRAPTPEGLGLEATVRYQKARLRVLQDEADSAMAQTEQLQTAHRALQTEVASLKADNATLVKKSQQTHQLLEKQRELSAAQEAKQRILESQLSAAQTQVEEIQRSEKMASQQFRSKDVRLNRALEELEKVKAQLQEEKQAHSEHRVTKSEYDQVVRENKRLEKQKNELLVAFKKQMKLIDLLKRQRIHMEAAKMLSFTEAEFSKTLELG